MKKLLLSLLLFLLLPAMGWTETLSLDCTNADSLTSFVDTVRGKNITGDTLIIADKDICARQMIAVKTETDAEGNVTVIRPAILGCFQFKGDEVSIFIGQRVIRGKTALSGQRLTITNITDTGVNP